MSSSRQDAPLRVAVQMDPLEHVAIDKDSTFALMLEAQRRGHALWHYDVRALALTEGRTGSSGAEGGMGHPRTESPAAAPGAGRTERLLAHGARPVEVWREAGRHHRFGAPVTLDLARDVDVVLMRQDPPFDMAYITATHMLEHVHPATLVVNDPRSVRESPEKILVTHFPELMPPTLITWSLDAIRDFRARHADIIVKPLFGNGGAGVFRIRPDDENLAALLEMHWARSREPLMFQRYEPAVRAGDKRIVLVDGRAVGAINRVPPQGDARSNMHVGGRAERATLTARDREIVAAIGPRLRDAGLLFVGIDVIGDWLTEINVTSPTGLQEIDRFDGIDTAGLIWDAIERQRAGRVPA